MAMTWTLRWGPRRSGGQAAARDVAGWNVADLAIAVALSAVPVAAAAGVLTVGGRHPGVLACLAVTGLTLPVAWRRRRPLGAAGVMAAAATLNGLVFGQLARCGVALPAVYVVAFGIAARADRRRAIAGLALCAADVVIEGYYDPRIGWAGTAFTLPLMLAFAGGGLMLRSRNRKAEALRAKSAQLREQREMTAKLAVLADREALSADIGSTLHTRLGVIAGTAAAALTAADVPDQVAGSQPPVAGTIRALAAIEYEAREALGQLREVVSDLRRPFAPSELTGPQPTLAGLPEFLSRLPAAKATLLIEGERRSLPTVLELSGYRIVEHLAEALGSQPHGVIEVRLAYGTDALELHVTGRTSARTMNLRAVLAAARERAMLHGGTVEGRIDDGVCVATARLPLVSGYV